MLKRDFLKYEKTLCTNPVFKVITLIINRVSHFRLAGISVVSNIK